MASIVMQMTAMAGIADEHCAGCDKAFEHGEPMNGVQYENGDKAGWFCKVCVDYWKAHGEPPGCIVNQKS